MVHQQHSKRNKITPGNIYDRCDKFGSAAPPFTVEQKSQVGTSIGTCATFILTVTMFWFAGTRLMNVIFSHNPLIAIAEQEDQFITSNETLKPDHFAVAFTIEEIFTHEVL